MFDRQRLIDIGRGVVDANEIDAVIAILPDDCVYTMSGDKSFPGYAKSEVVLRTRTILSPLDAGVLISRWRQALDLPEPIGSTP